MLAIFRRLCVLVFALMLALPAVAETDLDVRLVVDISGSMKENDPNNMRRPAVGLITELLRDGTRAGVWTFGEYVNMLVPHGNVDRQWRDLALKRAPEISSIALRTHIGRALEVASDDFYRDQHRENTHFILLTDGMVDIVPSYLPVAVARNGAERKRILAEVVPSIAARGASIHAIALSRNADLALLKQMALATGGSFAVAETDESLSRVFLQALERTGPSEEVPLLGNRFTIDDSISEYTAVIFHAPGETMLKLKSPDGELFSREGESRAEQAAPGATGSVRWLGGDDYTLVTVESPVGGEWEIQGSLDEGSRIKVVSDLGMVVSDLPRYFLAADELPLNVSFESSGERITDPDFLKFITVKVQLLTEDGRTGSKMLSDAGSVPEDGVYRDLISRLKQPGEYTFTVVADGGTFQRQSRQTLTLRPPLDVDVIGEGAADQSTYEIQVRVNQPNLSVGETGVTALISGPDGSTRSAALTYNATDGHWTHSLTGEQGSGEYSATVELRAGVSAEDEPAYTSPSFSLVLPRQNAEPDYQSVEAPKPPPTQAAAERTGSVVAGQEGPETAPEQILPEEPEPEASTIVPDLKAAAENAQRTGESPTRVAGDSASQVPEPESQVGESSFLLGGWLWWLAGGLAFVGLGGGAWLVYRKRGSKNIQPDTAPAVAEPVAESDLVEDKPVDEQPEEAEPEQLSDDELQDDGAETPDDELSEEDADQLVDRILAESESEPEPDPGDPSVDEQEPLDDDDDEFSLEDLDLTEPTDDPDNLQDDDPDDEEKPRPDKA